MNIQVGDSVTVSSDKGIRRTTGNNFEALGNVIIINKDEAIYGEKATLQMDTGQIDVMGNVRYVGPMMTMYGQELSYNIHTKFLSVINGKIVAEGYTVWGEYMARIAPEKVIAKKAEYTTCLDCPESWTVYGEHIKLTFGQYIHIRPALIKSNGAPIFYSPYAVFPIKKGRQTGLLFPRFSFSFRQGVNYQQPFFWAISDNKDMTLTPKVNDIQGVSTEVEYRHVVGESKWFQLNSFGARDLVYLPNDEGRMKKDETTRPSNTHYYRYMLDYEHHYQFGNYVNHHLVLNDVRDKDLLIDQPEMMKERLIGSELPNWGFVNARTSLMDFNVEASFNNNLLTDNSSDTDTRYGDGFGFDHSYVQTLPRVSLGLIPIPIVQSDTPFFQNINLGVSSIYTRFRQNHIKEKTKANGDYGFARNAERLEVYPTLDWVFGSLGPVTIKSQLSNETQFYRMKHRSHERSYRKSGNILSMEMFFEVDRVFAPAYREVVPVTKVIPKEGHEEVIKKEKETSKEGTLGHLPEIGKYYTDDEVVLEKPSYRHSMLYNFRYFRTINQKGEGSYHFGRQIRNTYGLFDENDKPKELTNAIGSNESTTNISKRNTIEFRLFNSLFKKQALHSGVPPDGSYLMNNFSYSKLAYFDISQGIEVDSNFYPVDESTGQKMDRKRYQSFKDRLTRLYVVSGFPIKNWSLGISDYYFYQSDSHKATLSASTAFGTTRFSFSYTYDSVGVVDPNKSWTVSTSFFPLSTVAYSGSYSYDLKKSHYIESKHAIIYVPLNNCWRADLSYSERPSTYRREWDLQFNFYVNFGENKFVSILTPGGVGQDGTF